MKFLDISRAFDRIWQTGVFFKLQILLPHTCYLLLKFCLTDQYFTIKYKDVLSDYYHIKPSVSQGSALGLIVYLIRIRIYTVDIPVATVATFADDTALLSTHKELIVALKTTTAYDYLWRLDETVDKQPEP